MISISCIIYNPYIITFLSPCYIYFIFCIRCLVIMNLCIRLIFNFWMFNIHFINFVFKKYLFEETFVNKFEVQMRTTKNSTRLTPPPLLPNYADIFFLIMILIIFLHYPAIIKKKFTKYIQNFFITK